LRSHPSTWPTHVINFMADLTNPKDLVSEDLPEFDFAFADADVPAARHADRAAGLGRSCVDAG
jgi:hypothetical protein